MTPPAHRYGTRLPVGLGWSTVLPEMDFETRSPAGYRWDAEAESWKGPPGASKDAKGLPVVGAEPYAAHREAFIVWLAYDLKDGLGWRQWRPGCAPPLDLLGYLAAGGLMEAHNVGFERWIWKHVCVGQFGWPAVDDSQWRCSAAKARASGLPGSLEPLGKVLDLRVQKDPAGTDLMKKFSMPRKPTAADPRLWVPPIYDERDAAAESERLVALLHAKEPGMSDRKLAGVQTRARARVIEDHADTLAYGRYNVTDIVSEAEASSRMPDLEGDELRFWQVHESINRRGVHIDRVGVENCIAVVHQVFAKYNTELVQLTGIDAASKVAQLQGWLRARGVHLEKLDEEHVEEALTWPGLPPECRRVLEIRAAAGSASIKKLFAMRNRLSSDDRLRDLYIFCGARTGRSTGEGPQPTNLPKAGPNTIRCTCKRHYGPHLMHCPWCSTAKPADAREVEWNPSVAEDALTVIAHRRLDLVEAAFGNAFLTLAGCLRGLFVAAPGHDLISTDYSSIEAIGLAMMAGEEWRIEVFRTHGKIYEVSASQMFKVPFEEFEAHKKSTGQHHPLRQKGKIGELGFGFQGWVDAARAFGMPGTDEEIQADILAWRAASPAVEWFWGGQEKRKATAALNNATAATYRGAVDDRLLWLVDHTREGKWDRTSFLFGVEGMAVLALQQHNEWHEVTRLNGTASGIAFRYDTSIDVLYCRLLSGRRLQYHQPRLRPSDRGGQAISYWGWNSNPKNGPYGWICMDIWGGRFVENIDQAACRDILRACLIECEDRGYPVVLHTYDEPVSEISEGVGSIEEYERICTEAVIARCPWAHDWPIKAPGGYRAKRYRKG